MVGRGGTGSIAKSQRSFSINAHVDPEGMPSDRFDPAVMRTLRLIPMACVLEGFIVWCARTDALAVSEPRKRVPAPMATDTACLSITDYRCVVRAIADAEES
jgi:hypothetical protein